MDELRLYQSVTLYKKVPEELKSVFELSTRVANEFYCVVNWKGSIYYAYCRNISTVSELMDYLAGLIY